MNRNHRALVFVFAFAMVADSAFAQRGSIRGKFVDEEGNAVEGMECLIEMSDGGGRRTTAKTRGNGEFTKGGVRSGTYTITCEKEGFRKLALRTQVSGFEQANLGENVVYKLAAGELSESQHARATELLEEFNLAAESGDDAGTLEKLKELEQMMPDSPEVAFNIAGTHEKLGNKQEAIEYYRKSAEMNPDLAYDCFLAIADMHGKDKEWSDAASAMKQAMDIKAVDPVAMFNYGVYAQNAGDTDAAEMAYAKTLEIDPSRALAHYQLGLIAVNEADDEAAIVHFEKFLELAPDHAQAAAAKGVVEALKQKQSQQQ